MQPCVICSNALTNYTVMLLHHHLEKGILLWWTCSNVDNRLQANWEYMCPIQSLYHHPMNASRRMTARNHSVQMQCETVLATPLGAVVRIHSVHGPWTTIGDRDGNGDSDGDGTYSWKCWWRQLQYQLFPEPDTSVICCVESNSSANGPRLIEFTTPSSISTSTAYFSSSEIGDGTELVDTNDGDGITRARRDCIGWVPSSRGT